jgi:plastocyanin
MLGLVAGRSQAKEGKWAMRKAFGLIPMQTASKRHPLNLATVRGPSLYRVALFAVLIVLLGACSGSDGEISLVADRTESDSEDPLGFALAGEDVTGVGPTLTVRAGEEVTLTLENHDGLQLHDFAVVPKLEDLPKAAALGNLEEEILWESSIEDLSDGESSSVTFTPDTPGSYYYVCTLPQHAGAGMMGEFVVVDEG